ncbi:YicC/YloC family endoribonuclease [Halocynthiibacter namhaensis]|uniref:YicC/YloC family endoribonuclease n=1 Tax=Halocynthiibacter namhaensis TaxID=1290553 RepID=UPI001EE2FF52|nr:YicC/YloC family endoribonuclease [Halocynthiibacter namhaensis]
MTGFASGQGAKHGFSWTWELRAVNARGLDLRLRMPDWLPGLEQTLRTALTGVLARGSVTLNLRLTREETASSVRVVPETLTAALENLNQIEATARAAGVALVPTTALDVMALRGVLDSAPEITDAEALSKTLQGDFASVLQDFLDMRAAEGLSLADIIDAQLTEIEQLTEQATAQARARLPKVEQAFRENIARILDNSEAVDEGRLAQELALLAVKADVTEETDRLLTHIKAARALLGEDGPRGRKFDFLMQEFNREANTLCSKSQDSDLTATGLDLKAVIDQMREQIQNVE